MQKQKGFTLIELLIVISVLGILATVVFLALNPLARYQESRNTKRWTDVIAIADAINLYQLDNKGIHLDSITNAGADRFYQIGTATASCNIQCNNPNIVLQASCIDISGLVNAGYLPEIPVDPNASTASLAQTHYYIAKFSSGHITVGNCNEENGSASSPPTIETTK